MIFILTLESEILDYFLVIEFILVINDHVVFDSEANKWL